MTIIAFFDVDETLIRPKSMFALMEFYLKKQYPDGAEIYKKHWQEISSLAQAGTPRSEVNRCFYSLWAGELTQNVKHAGREWVHSEYKKGNFLLCPSMDALEKHRNQGHKIALVSGSFPAVLKPICELVNADYILCSRPLSQDGRLTGAIQEPMIGANKARAAQDLMAKTSASPQLCFAYGDHLSDLDLLEAVGNPRIIPNDSDLIAIATNRNWRFIQ